MSTPRAELLNRHQHQLTEFTTRQRQYIDSLDELREYLLQHFQPYYGQHISDRLDSLYKIPADKLISNDVSASVFRGLMYNLVNFKKTMGDHPFSHNVLCNAIWLTVDMAKCKKMWSDPDFAQKNMGAFSNAMKAATDLINYSQVPECRTHYHTQLTMATRQMKWHSTRNSTMKLILGVFALALSITTIALFPPLAIGIILGVPLAAIAGALAYDALKNKHAMPERTHEQIYRTADSLDDLANNPSSFFHSKTRATHTLLDDTVEASSSLAYQTIGV